MDISKNFLWRKKRLQFRKGWFSGEQCNSACNYYRNVQQVQTYPHKADHGSNKVNAHEGYTSSFVLVIKVNKIQV